MSDTIPVMMAVNDPQTGEFAGDISGLAIAELLELEMPFDDPPRFLQDRSTITIGNKRWPIQDYTYSVGNWCWNLYHMRPDITVQMLVWLHNEFRHAALTPGWTEMYDLWQQPVISISEVDGILKEFRALMGGT